MMTEMAAKKLPAAGVVSLLSFVLITTLYHDMVIAAAFDDGRLRMQTLVVVPLSATQQPLQREKQLPTVAAAEEASSDTASALVARLEILNGLDLLSPDELNSIDHGALFQSRMQRDKARVDAISMRQRRAAASASGGAVKGNVISGLSMGTGEYFTRLGLGTPPRNVYLTLDTGSDLTWIQCAGCRPCFNQTDPIFNPEKSRSFGSVGCRDQRCRRFFDASKPNVLCNQTLSEYKKMAKNSSRDCPKYIMRYGDGSNTTGRLFTDTLTFGGQRPIPGLTLGCGLANFGLFRSAAGILGLGRGEFSFTRQLARLSTSPSSHNLFSYCLPSLFNSSLSSSIDFGNYPNQAQLSNKALFTPLRRHPIPEMNSFYYVGLEGISVGGRAVTGIVPSMFKFETPSNISGGGGLIVDSGTTLTYLVLPAYKLLNTALNDLMRHVPMVPPPKESAPLQTCYDLSQHATVKVPEVVLHFQQFQGGQANVSLPAENIFIPVDNKGTMCLAFVPIDVTETPSILGNVLQQGFRVIYDLANSRIGFLPKQC